MIMPGYKLNISLAPKDFKPFYKGNFFSVKRRTNGLSHSRIGVIVSKKNSKTATGRNMIKRLVMNFFRENKNFLDKFNPPTDFLIVTLTTASDIKDNKEAFIQELKNVISL